MKRIVIIGIKGFIGSHLNSYLLKQNGYAVWGCDVVNDYTSKNYFVIDAGNPNFEALFIEQDFDVCINCSGSASVPDSMAHPLRDFYLNTVNVFKLVEAIRMCSPKCKFLTISSAAVYGNPVELPITESALVRPLSPYGYHKLQTENICEEYHRVYNIQTCSIRIFSAYGRGLKKQLFWDITQKISKAAILHLSGTGNESRDFIHVWDIIQAIELIIAKGDFNNGCYNIANGIEITIKEVAEKIIFLSGLKTEVQFDRNIRPGDPLNWKADITKIATLGYKQHINIEEGLTDYIKWLQEERLV